jgi:hypothetical protein
VPERLRDWAWLNGYDFVVRLSEERERFGMQKYGQTLMHSDGRDTSKDIMDEIGDMFHYLAKARMQGMDVSQFRPWIDAAVQLVDPGEDRRASLHAFDVSGPECRPREQPPAPRAPPP